MHVQNRYERSSNVSDEILTSDCAIFFPCSITVEFLDEFNKKKVGIEKRIDAVQ